MKYGGFFLNNDLELFFEYVSCFPPFFLKQRLAYAITPETEHHLVDNGEVRQFTVSVVLIMIEFYCYQNCLLLL